MDRVKARQYQEWYDGSDQKERLRYPLSLYHISLSEGLNYGNQIMIDIPPKFDVKWWL